MLLIQVEKVLAIHTGKVLGRKAFLWPIAAFHFFWFFWFPNLYWSLLQKHHCCRGSCGQRAGRPPSGKAALGCAQEPEEDGSMWPCFVLHGLRTQGHQCQEPLMFFWDQCNLIWVKNIILSWLYFHNIWMASHQTGGCFAGIAVLFPA